MQSLVRHVSVMMMSMIWMQESYTLKNYLNIQQVHYGQFLWGQAHSQLRYVLDYNSLHCMDII